MRVHPAYPPQSERRHYVFVAKCGCAIGLVEHRKGVATSEDEAWDFIYDERAEERTARSRGIRVKFVDHATYERDFYPSMLRPCTHGF